MLSKNPIKNKLLNFETRAKIVTFFIIILLASSNNDIKSTTLYLLLIVFISKLSGGNLRALLKRIRYPSLIIIMIGMFLLFATRGKPIVSITFLYISQEGLYAMIVLFCRFLGIVVTFDILYNQVTFEETASFLAWIKMPKILIDMIVFSFDYLKTFQKTFENMLTYSSLRGSNIRSFKGFYSIASIIGSVFIKSSNQAERSYDILTIRGYNQCEHINDTRGFSKISVYDLCLSLLLISIFLSIKFI